MHKNHPSCPYPTKKACEAAKRLEIGRCKAMKSDSEECTNWALDRIDETGYCGQHINSVLLKADNDRRAAMRKSELNGRITEYLTWRTAHPSLHDRMPRGT